MISLQKKFFLIGIIIVVALILVGISVGLAVIGAQQRSGDSPYVAVYMTTGDVYFGTLSWFPSLHLQDAWYLQRSTDAYNQPQFGVLPMKSVLWEPSGDLYLNEKNIVFWTHIQKGGRVEQFLQHPEVGSQPAPEPTLPQQQPSSTNH